MGCATIVKTFVGVEEMHMASIKRGASVASTLILIAIIISACNQPYSQQPSVTNTPINPNSLFGSPIPQTPSMSDVEVFGTGTALALTGTPVGGTIPTQTLGVDTTPQGVFVNETPTPLVSTNPEFTATATLAVSGGATYVASGPLPTSVPPSVRPGSYSLKSGEFPYCIARRFNVDPDDLLALSGLSDGARLYPAGTPLRIPQSGSFPGTRALRTHPATYTVASPNETIYSIACLFGDVDPGAIAQTNGLTSEGPLPTGKQLSIP
jgi:LysM repeat protein